MALITLHILAANQAYMAQMKAVYVPFHTVYSRLMCCQRLQSDRPKCWGRLAEVSHTSLCKSVSKTILICCENRECPSLSTCHLAVSWNYASYHTSYERGHSGLPADIKISKIFQRIGIIWSYFGVHLGSENMPLYFSCHSATSWYILDYYISEKGDIHSFNMRYVSMPHPKRLQRYKARGRLGKSPLVDTCPS